MSASSSGSSISKMSLADLLECSKCPDTTKCQYGEWELADELARRNNSSALAATYENGNAAQQAVILKAMYKMKGDAVLAFMRRVAYGAPKDAVADDPLWFALQYLAKRCEGEALDRLLGKQNFSDSYPIGCILWQDTIRQFGTCHYQPALPIIEKVAKTDYACVNINDAAEYSLRKLKAKK